MQRAHSVRVIGEVKRIEEGVVTAIAKVSQRQVIQPEVSLSAIKAMASRTMLANSEVQDVLQYGKATWDKWSEVWRNPIIRQLCMERRAVSATSVDGEELRIEARIRVITLGPVRAMIDEFTIQGLSPDEQKSMRKLSKLPPQLNPRYKTQIENDYEVRKSSFSSRLSSLRHRASTLLKEE